MCRALYLSGAFAITQTKLNDDNEKNKLEFLVSLISIIT